ncbi:MAG: hypothetical protein VX938_07040, partial [Myxococcota bacterium]|nr:hypothetical protein [Myxococcota bacterium]
MKTTAAKLRITIALLAGVCLALFGSPAFAEEPTPTTDETPEATTPVADEAPASSDAGAISTTSAVASDAKDEPAEEEAPDLISGSVTLSTGVGLGTLVHLHPDENISSQGGRELVTTGLSGSVRYKLGDTLSLSSGMALAWYPIINYAVGYENGRALLGDLAFTLNQSQIVKDEDRNLSVSGSLTVGLPTSLGSQIQNRLFSLTPKLNLSWSLGDLSVNYSASFAKYFMTSTTPSIDCENFSDPNTCPAGRGTGPAGAFQTEKAGGELFLPSTGINSFTIAHGGSVSYQVIEGLRLSAALGFSHSFSVVDTPIDEFSSVNANEGRSHVDGLSS